MNRLIAGLSRCQIGRARFLDCGFALNLKRRLSGPSVYVASVVLLGLVMLPASTAHAQTMLNYMIIPGPYSTSNPSSSGTIYTLPGYGPVQVSWTAISASLPTFSPQDSTLAHNQSAGGYSWGSDTQDINIFNSTAGTVTYNVTFSFQMGSPDLNKLVLVVAGLASGTTATVSQNVSLAGEFTFPLNPVTAPTRLTSGNFIESDYSPNHTNTDSKNTGWALFKVLPPIGNSLSVKFSHQSGDGIGVTLGYAVDKGILKVCKVAGPGVAVGTPFTFTAGSNTFTVPAGPAPGGTCVVGPSFPIGSTVTVAEIVPAGNTVSNITVAPPGQLVGTPNLASGSVTITVGAGVTEVTFTDKRTGFLEICKNPPVPGTVGGSFTFTVNPGGLGPFVVPSGACSPAIEVVAGVVVITELPTPGFTMSSCSTIPAGQQGPCNLVSQTSTVTVSPGNISTMTIAFITNH